MSVASATPTLDLFEALVLGVWLIGIPGVVAGGITSLTCGRELRSFNLVGALDCGGRHDQRQRVLNWRDPGVPNQTRGRLMSFGGTNGIRTDGL